MSVEDAGRTLLDTTVPLKDRLRALYTLSELGGNEAVDTIDSCFNDDSDFLKHELAYCLGQMQNVYAIPKLIRVLEDKNQGVIVRHEAGEALGAIGDPSVREVLTRYSQDPQIEIAETCQLALSRLDWVSQNYSEESNLVSNPFQSIDPAPAVETTDVEELTKLLLDDSLSLFDRYRAIFSLRNLATRESVLALAKGLKCKSALFRHEIAFVLGQLKHDACINQLAETLRDENENFMVRHECADALGAIGTDESTAIVRPYLNDNDPVIRESCLAGLNISEYEIGH